MRGIGRRSASPPYSTLCATLLAAETSWSGFGIEVHAAKIPERVGDRHRRLRGTNETMKWTRAGALGAAALGAVAAHDLTQKKHAILRNFPVVGHLRFQLERFGPELRQYIVTSNDEERPFSRDQRRWVYASSKLQNNYFGFGTDNDMENARRVRRDQAPHVPRPGRAHRRPRPRAEPAPVGQGAGRTTRPAARVPARRRSSTSPA